MPQYISEEFAFITRDNIINILESSITEVGVKVLMETMKATIRFETELCHKFSSSKSDSVGKFTPEDSSDSPQTIVDPNPYSPEAIKQKWKNFMTQQEVKKKNFYFILFYLFLFIFYFIFFNLSFLFYFIFIF